jgi:hypothetical protein
MQQAMIGIDAGFGFSAPFFGPFGSWFQYAQSVPFLDTGRGLPKHLMVITLF